MDIHKPKAWHSLREFLKEYLIIVVGVLTALGAEQGVEWLHWRHEAAIADAALLRELHFMGNRAFEAVVAWPCEQKRLDQLSADLRHTKGMWKAQWYDNEGTRTAFVAPAHAWLSTSWEEYKSNGAVQHLPDDRRRLFGTAYVDVEGERAWDATLGQASAELAILTDDLPLSEVTRDRELAAIERARHAGAFAARVGKQFVGVLGRLGLTFTEAEQHPDVAACRARFSGATAEER
jgi:hypothetical protein